MPQTGWRASVLTKFFWTRLRRPSSFLWTGLWRVCAPWDARDKRRAQTGVQRAVHSPWTPPWKPEAASPTC